MKKKYIILSFIILFALFVPVKANRVNADDLSDAINEEIENIDLSEMEKLYNDVNLSVIPDFSQTLNDILSGKFTLDYDDFGEYIKSIFFNDIKSLLPVFCGVIAIALICSLLNDFKSNRLSNGVGNVVSLTGLCSVLILLLPQTAAFCVTSKNVIENIAKISEIMSPIMLTLMVSSGAEASAAIYKPSFVFLSSGIVNVFLLIILPITELITVFSIIGVISPKFKFTKFSDFFGSVIKWITGFISIFFGVFLSVQGITSATYDGVSIKTAKYIVSNSVPLMGGLLKEGLDVFLAGSVIIKNAVGIIGLIVLLFYILSPIVQMIAFIFFLKITAAITDCFSFSQTSALLSSLSKGVTYLIMSVLTVGFMFFLTVLLTVISASALI